MMDEPLENRVRAIAGRFGFDECPVVSNAFVEGRLNPSRIPP
jgi:hypothetical protein